MLHHLYLFFQSIEGISLDELKSEKCVRISAEDLIELGELAGPAYSRSPTKRKTNSKPMLLSIDVRNPEEYPSLSYYTPKRKLRGFYRNQPVHLAVCPNMVSTPYIYGWM